MAEIGPNLATNSDEDATEALWAEHREHTARLERTEFHLIVASWNAGRSMDWIADRAGTPERRKSRTPIRAALYRADAMGLLRRPLGGSGGRAPYLNVTEPTGDAGGQPHSEQG